MTVTHTCALPDEAATLRFGARLAALLRRGDMLVLIGDLGAGKTTLVRGLIRSLCGDHTDVPSPTFTLVQTYETGIGTLWHFDLYRLESPDEVRELGLEEALEDICLIEWPEKAGHYLPKTGFELRLTFEGEGRNACLTGHGTDEQNRVKTYFDAS